MAKRSYQDVINDLVAEVETKEQDVVSLKRIINDLRVRSGDAPLYDAQDLDRGSGPSTIKDDQFYGRKLATVVKEVLSLKGSACKVTEIYNTLVEGGFKFDTKNDDNAKRSLRISLSKNPAFHRLPNGSYGLLDWYPAVKAKGDGASDASDKASHDGGDDDVDSEEKQGPDDE